MDVAVGTKDTAVAQSGSEICTALGALMGDQSEFGGYLQFLDKTAFRAGQIRFGDRSHHALSLASVFGRRVITAADPEVIIPSPAAVVNLPPVFFLLCLLKTTFE